MNDNDGRVLFGAFNETTPLLRPSTFRALVDHVDTASDAQRKSTLASVESSTSGACVDGCSSGVWTEVKRKARCEIVRLLGLEKKVLKVRVVYVILPHNFANNVP